MKIPLLSVTTPINRVINLRRYKYAISSIHLILERELCRKLMNAVKKSILFSAFKNACTLGHFEINNFELEFEYEKEGFDLLTIHFH